MRRFEKVMQSLLVVVQLRASKPWLNLGMSTVLLRSSTSRQPVCVVLQPKVRCTLLGLA